MRSTVIAALCLFATATVCAAPVAYTLDPNHTQVQFSWNHMQFSNPEAGFDDVTGTLMWDAENIAKSSVTVTIDVASIHSHVAALDEKLKSAEFLDVAHYPKATFVSTRVQSTGVDDHLRIDGNLTVHGVTHPVTLHAQIKHVGIYPMLEVPAAGFAASTVIKRAQFGVGEGIPYVSDDLQVRITTEALEAAGFAKAMAAMAQKK